jgi:hypothetical protein
MQMEDNFYVTLPSNASLDLFPENQLDHFKTQLSMPIELSGKWECGVHSISFPSALRTDYSGTLLIITEISSERDVLRQTQSTSAVRPYNPDAAKEGVVVRQEKPSEVVPPTEIIKSKGSGELRVVSVNLEQLGNYHTIDDFVQALNQSLRHPLLNDRFYKEEDNTLYKQPISVSLYPHLRIVIRDEKCFLVLSANIAQLLGFPLADNEWLEYKKIGIYNYPNIFPNLHALKPRFFYVYCNFIAPQFLGNTFVPLLQTVTFPSINALIANDTSAGTAKKSTINEQLEVKYSPVQYVPVSQSTLTVLELDFRSPTGSELGFQFGLVYVVLHFRKQRRQVYWPD